MNWFNINNCDFKYGKGSIIINDSGINTYIIWLILLQMEFHRKTINNKCGILTNLKELSGITILKESEIEDSLIYLDEQNFITYTDIGNYSLIEIVNGRKNA